MSRAEAHVFGTLFDEHREQLRRYLAKFCPESDIDDIIQDTFVVAQTYVVNGRSIGSPIGFLYGTARNVVMSGNRHKKIVPIEHVGDTEELGLETEDANAEERAVSGQEFFDMCEAVARMPPRCKQVFVLKKVYGMTTPEIAKECGLAQNTVRAHLVRAYKLCNKYIDDLNNLRAASG